MYAMPSVLTTVNDTRKEIQSCRQRAGNSSSCCGWGVPCCQARWCRRARPRRARGGWRPRWYCRSWPGCSPRAPGPRPGAAPHCPGCAARGCTGLRVGLSGVTTPHTSRHLGCPLPKLMQTLNFRRCVELCDNHRTCLRHAPQLTTCHEHDMSVYELHAWDLSMTA